MGKFSFSANDLARVQTLFTGEMSGCAVIEGDYDIPSVADPSSAGIRFIVDDDDDWKNGRIIVDIYIEEGQEGLKITNSDIYVDDSRCGGAACIHHSYAAGLNDAFIKGVVRELTGRLTKLMRPRPTASSDKPINLYSVFNPTQPVGLPRRIEKWMVVDEVERFGKRYYRVLDPGDPEKPPSAGVIGGGYRPINVILAGPKGSSKAFCYAYRRVLEEIERHKGADFRVWYLTDEGVLWPFGDNNPIKKGFRVDLSGGCWWKGVLRYLYTGEGSYNDDMPAVFIRDPANDPFTLGSCGWPIGRVSFARNEWTEHEYGVEAEGQQTLDAYELSRVWELNAEERRRSGIEGLTSNDIYDIPAERELRRIAQGLSQRYFEALQRQEETSYFLVSVDSVIITKSP